VKISTRREIVKEELGESQLKTLPDSGYSLII
jgi:hypothetical protein